MNEATRIIDALLEHNKTADSLFVRNHLLRLKEIFDERERENEMKYKNEILSDLEHLQKFAEVLHKGILLGDEKAYKVACEIVGEAQRVRMKYVIEEKVEKFMETGILEKSE